jgi:hypothetical protein
VDDFEVVGDGDEVGAILSRATGRVAPQLASRQQPTALRVARPAWLAPEGVPQGVTLPREELDPLPFQAATLTNTATTGELIALPQRPFRGERLILGAVYVPSGGSPTDGSGFVVISPAIFVGSTQVGASQGDLPISAFSPTAFGVRLSFPHAGQGTRIFLPIKALIPLAAGDVLTVFGTVIGRAVR